MRRAPTYPIALYLSALGTMLLACADEREEVRPTVGLMTESVYASVQIEPEDLYSAYAAVPGIVAEILVADGDTVVRGQVIAKIDEKSLDLNVQDAALAANLASDNYKGQATVLASLANEIASVSEQYRLDSINRARQERLWSQRIGSEVEVENARLRADMSRNTLDRLKTNYRQKENELQTTYRRSLNAVEKSRSALDDHLISSRMDGVVYAMLKEEGEQVGMTEAVAKIGRAGEFVIVMAIDEVDIARLEIGQQVWVTVDAYEGQVFEARLQRIYPLKDERTQTFTVEATFVDAPARLYAGLSGEANIVLSERDDALTIPLDYLKDGGRVMTPDGEVEVAVGMRSLERVEILSGIDSTTVIIKGE